MRPIFLCILVAMATEPIWSIPMESESSVIEAAETEFLSTSQQLSSEITSMDTTGATSSQHLDKQELKTTLTSLHYDKPSDVLSYEQESLVNKANYF